MPYTKVFDKGFSFERKCYYKDKECTILHREDGAAIEYKYGPVNQYLDSRKYYYLNNKCYSKEDYLEEIVKRRFGDFI